MSYEPEEVIRVEYRGGPRDGEVVDVAAWGLEMPRPPVLSAAAPSYGPFARVRYVRVGSRTEVNLRNGDLEATEVYEFAGVEITE